MLAGTPRISGGDGTGGGGVTSVFGRSGAVTAQSGDYTTTLVTEGTNLYFTNARALASTLTGYVSGAGTISSTDSILSAIQKLNGNIGALVTGVSSVSNSDGTLTISPTTGAVVASLALGHANTWTGVQTYTKGIISSITTPDELFFSATSSNTHSLQFGIGQGSIASTGTNFIRNDGSVVMGFIGTTAISFPIGVFDGPFSGTWKFRGPQGGSTATTSFMFSPDTFDQGSMNPTSGSQINFKLGGDTNEIWNPISGNATFTTLSLNPNINMTGTASGAVTDFLINRTETAVLGTQKFASFQVGGTEMFSVNNKGLVLAGTSNSDGVAGYAFVGFPTSGFFKNATGGANMDIQLAGQTYFQLNNNFIYSSKAYANGSTENNCQFTLSTTGMTLQRNIADATAANAVLTITRSSATSLADILSITTTTNTLTSGVTRGLTILTNYNQASGTAVNTDFLINRVVQTAVGSGAQFLADWQVVGTSKFNVNNIGLMNSIHLGGISGTPTIAAGVGAGTSPTVTVTGTDTAGVVNVTTGTLPTLAAVIFTVTFNVGYATAPYIEFSPANANTALLSGATMVFATSTTTTFSFTAGATALTAATGYSWNYHSIQ